MTKRYVFYCYSIMVHKLLKNIQPYFGSRISKSLLNQFPHLLLTLRLNLSCVDLGFRFKVHMSTGSHIFYYVIDILLSVNTSYLLA